MEIDLLQVQSKDVTDNDPQIVEAILQLDSLCDKIGLKLKSPESLKELYDQAKLSFDVASFRYAGLHGVQVF